MYWELVRCVVCRDTHR